LDPGSLPHRHAPHQPPDATVTAPPRPSCPAATADAFA